MARRGAGEGPVGHDSSAGRGARRRSLVRLPGPDRQDLSFLGGILRWAFALALLLIVAATLFGLQLGTFFSVAMVGLAGAAILHDTSNVLHHYPEDRYVAAALELFASVALMFWYVLRLFLASRR